MRENVALDSVLHETRIYKPSPEFVRNAWVPDYQKLYDSSMKDRERFWEQIGGDISTLEPGSIAKEE